MGQIRWKLKHYLEKHNISAYRLAQTLGTKGRMPTIYRLAREGDEPSRIDLPTLASVIDGLRELTGEEITVCDLLEYQKEGRQ